MKLTKSALITGATGQDGHYLTALLCRLGYTVHAQSRSASRQNANDMNVYWHVGDLTDGVFLEALIASAEPDEIYNLAAVSRPTISWIDSARNCRNQCFCSAEHLRIVEKAQTSLPLFPGLLVRHVRRRIHRTSERTHSL